MPVPLKQETRSQLWGYLFFTFLPALFLVASFASPKGPEELVVILRDGPGWVVWVARVILAGVVVMNWQFVARPALQEFRRSSGQDSGAEPSAKPAPGTVPDPPTAGDLWVLIIVPQVTVWLCFCIALFGAPVEGRDWSWFCILGGFAFLGICATASSIPRLRELARRGAPARPGTRS
jgi:hypothetical protein